MSFELPVYNPSDYQRGGCITLRWELIAKQAKQKRIDPKNMVILDEVDGTPLPFQFDEIDPRDPSLHTLSIKLEKPLSAGDEDYSHSSGSVILDKGRRAFSNERQPKVRRSDDNSSLILSNDELEVRFSLIPELTNDERAMYPVYAGCVSSVLTKGQEEILDINPDIKEHDVEKRCMQLDYILLPMPAWELRPTQRVDMFNRKYEVISSKEGPIRAYATIASEPFDHQYWDPITHTDQRLNCRLYRVISLYTDANYLVEELFVKGFPYEQDPLNFVYLEFVAGYFAYLPFKSLLVSRFENVPDWFAAIHPQRWFNGYGFATDKHTRSVVTPDFPDPQRQPYSLSWELFPCRAARCLHLFARFHPDDKVMLPGETLFDAERRKNREAKRFFEDQIGRAWYENIYKPLLAK